MKATVAVLLTVFNRKDVTLKGLSTLYAAMKSVSDRYSFDIYMTNDGCTDGTPEAVKKQFPDVNIVNGDGNLYWSGGMRKAWQAAIDSQEHYDFYLWFNDDATLYEDALEILLSDAENIGNNSIISGAFRDRNGNVSYGGKDKEGLLIDASEHNSDIYFMNGNLVIIPAIVFNRLGVIDPIYSHGLGDWDYGLRAKKAGFRVAISSKFVGVTDRHDNDINPFWSSKYPMTKRLNMLRSPKYSIFEEFHFNKRHLGFLFAVRKAMAKLLFSVFPSLCK